MIIVIENENDKQYPPLLRPYDARENRENFANEQRKRTNTYAHARTHARKQQKDKELNLQCLVINEPSSNGAKRNCFK